MQTNFICDAESDIPHRSDTNTWSDVLFRIRVINLAGVVIPFAGFIAAFILLWGTAFNGVYLGLLLGMYAITAVGVTIGYHRYFTHKSFKTSRPVAILLGILGSMAVEGAILQWVAVHRQHHHHSDETNDPHSPHTRGGGFFNMLIGFWHAHLGWMFQPDPHGLEEYVKDLKKEKYIVWLSRLAPLWIVLGLIIPTILGGIIVGSWTGALLGFLWGGAVRVFLVHHVTWSINSVCHIWGSKPFKSHDESRNNAIFGILAFGEGWHNNHHAFPTSARHGLRWWEFDLSYLIIRVMALVGLVSNVQVPSRKNMADKHV